MSNVIQFPVIAGVEITTDAEGRFNLNALHRASGEGDHKKPSKWLRTEMALELAKELEGQISPSKPTSTIKGRGITGTFAHELLAVSYAGWISPAFQLRVNQTFIDYRAGKLQQPAIPQSLPEALRLAAELAEANEAMKPKVEAYDRIATSDGGICITNAAKDLQMRPKDLFAWLSSHQWIYRRAGGSGWIAYQDKLQTGYLEHKVTVVYRNDGSEKTTEQVLVTPKGLAKLASKIERQTAA
ncbi:phage antirepressor KilAC domain-containing protein [Spongiibacter tropicus]|uniref:phage antirepressor KilAC domain-containing protein n=1 Tax=Spongiibacter tropicus TaxID=454602 RepID=UPI0003B537E0|nr:phage antirepressor KilAC domain-containing protein [Spongiibacter tropicus]